MPPLTIKRILIDVDGTITDSPDDSAMEKSPLHHLVELVMERHGIGANEAELKIRNCGCVETRCLSEFLPALGVDPLRYFKSIKEDLARHMLVTEDAVRFLKAMREQGIPVCTATTNSRFMTLAKLAVAGLADINGSPCIETFHAGCEFGDPEGKFSRHFFPNILKYHGYDPETTMMIGDEPEHDLYPALNAGIRHCVILDRKQKEAMLQKEGGIFARDLDVVNEIISTKTEEGRF